MTPSDRSRANASPLLVVVLLVVSLSIFPTAVSAEEPTATETATATPIPVRFFNVRLVTKTLDKPAGPLQDVQGKVVSKTGTGIDGVVVRAFSSDWQAFESTRDGGKFKFALSSGSYTVQLVEMVAQEVKLIADGKSELQVEFYEVESIPPTATSSAISSTPTETATATPTDTATPLAATSTPLPLPTSITGTTVDQPTPTATAAFPLPIPTDIDVRPWLEMLLYGAGLGGALVVLGLAVGLVRRL